jgi:Ca-activated chloride channel family protein
VTFASPLFLLGLLVVPLAIAAWVARRQRVRRYAIRFPAVSSAVAAVGRTPAWRPFVPMALLLASLAALVVALAKPERTVAVPIEKATIMLVTDHSRSMSATDVEPNRLAAAQRAARAFLDKLPGPVRVGAVAYSDAPDAVQAPSTDHDDARRIIDGQIADGATATGDALQVAIDALRNDRQNGKRPPSAIVLLSDGKTTTGRDPLQVARQAGRAKVPIFTVALGTPGATIPNPYPYASPLPVPPDPVTLKRIAQESKGRAYTVEDSNELSSIYQRLGSSIGTKKHQQEITAVFAIGGLLLLAAAAGASMRWSGRLP